ncbi:maleylpyruvate isomerase family mycothiol-dependent enzyme [Nocardioides sp. B-3]|uniref:maleylpyruvate isomerase family mycothiol-dependent enzyme n=1 Tax=Nocardioides sp. B-3 TaxID=2895565 RepID=UPI0021537C6A|nr:maleylpyruvate isomerase family mycothiol-dependent enzyme [Nocardioides sp. B-3]UUZ58494.1 maleylpyruvate isomerase family mycothiol-dependent enzyme [Nocardioides sp. B-3]
MTTSTNQRAAHLPQTSRADAERHSTAEYAALVARVGAPEPEHWAAQTDCTEWTVRELVAHLAGASEEAVRMGVSAVHMTKAALRLRKPSDRDPAGHVCDLQIERRAGMSAEELRADLERWAAGAPRARRRQPRLMRAVKLPTFAGLRPGVRMSYALDVIYTRDLWLHRVDLARATGQPMPTSTAEGEVVARVVRDLDAAWTGPAFELVLTGRGGGSWLVGEGAVTGRLEGDAVTVMRSLSGRHGDVPLDGPTRLADELRAARVVF